QHQDPLGAKAAEGFTHRAQACAQALRDLSRRWTDAGGSEVAIEGELHVEVGCHFAVARLDFARLLSEASSGDSSASASEGGSLAACRATSAGTQPGKAARRARCAPLAVCSSHTL